MIVQHKRKRGEVTVEPDEVEPDQPKKTKEPADDAVEQPKKKTKKAVPAGDDEVEQPKKTKEPLAPAVEPEQPTKKKKKTTEPDDEVEPDDTPELLGMYLETVYCLSWPLAPSLMQIYALSGRLMASPRRSSFKFRFSVFGCIFWQKPDA